MKNHIRNQILKVVFFGLLASFTSTKAWALVLPDPTTVVDGLPIVRVFDDFLSYSAKLLIEWDNLFVVPWNGDDFNVAVGTGNLDVKIMTPSHAPGDNDPVSAGGTDFSFQDSLISSTGSQEPTFNGTWGYFQPPAANPQAIEGPVLVDTLLAYLQKAFGPNATVPVFAFDMNETGNSPDIFLAARVQVIDPGCIDDSSAECDPENTANDTVIAEWSLDNLAQAGNGLYDPDQPITVEGQICVDGLTQDFCVTNNSVGGSGKMDFLVLAPTMDLSLYDGMGYWFVGTLNMGTTEQICVPPEHGNGPDKCSYIPGALDNGGDELFISGGFTPFRPPEPIVPEPATGTVFGLGLAAAALIRRFKKS